MSCGASSSSCNSWVHRTCNSCHGGSRVSGSPPIYDCGDIAVVRTTRTTKNLGKQFWSCANFKRCGDDVLGCNFFKWCYKEGVDERDAIIARQRQKITYMENSLSVWKKRIQLSLAVIGVLIVMNVVVFMGCNCHWLS
ncbi:hypothetical protein DEO72_LG8g1360 [Vigna unguiculata]|uniref:GRF-type domain-containing protein n=1 Tax=Vigna unguiculata TaxID=3917 RepID=A0A4D6MPH6_VIGUN|nr:hypothetical protein DEO72_LG8g1360 [Vigna unguiculata]